METHGHHKDYLVWWCVQRNVCVTCKHVNLNLWYCKACVVHSKAQDKWCISVVLVCVLFYLHNQIRRETAHGYIYTIFSGVVNEGLRNVILNGKWKDKWSLFFSEAASVGFLIKTDTWGHHLIIGSNEIFLAYNKIWDSSKVWLQPGWIRLRLLLDSPEWLLLDCVVFMQVWKVDISFLKSLCLKFLNFSYHVNPNSGYCDIYCVFYHICFFGNCTSLFVCTSFVSTAHFIIIIINNTVTSDQTHQFFIHVYVWVVRLCYVRACKPVNLCSTLPCNNKITRWSSWDKELGSN